MRQLDFSYSDTFMYAQFIYAQDQERTNVFWSDLNFIGKKCSVPHEQLTKVCFVSFCCNYVISSLIFISPIYPFMSRLLRKSIPHSIAHFFLVLYSAHIIIKKLFTLRYEDTEAIYPHISQFIRWYFDCMPLNRLLNCMDNKSNYTNDKM